jgi:ATP synthase protein I
VEPRDQQDELPPNDPRLEIPEVLRTPVRQPGEIPGEPRPPKGTLVSSAGVGFGMAFDFIGTIGGGVLVGWLVDRWQGTTPIFVLVGLGLGFVGAMFRIVAQTKRQERREKAARK